METKRMIPQFYYKGKRNCCFNKPKFKEMFDWKNIFKDEQIPTSDFMEIMGNIIGWSSLFIALLHDKVSVCKYTDNYIDRSRFVNYWNEYMQPYDEYEQLFWLLSQSNLRDYLLPMNGDDLRDYLLPIDFIQLVRYVISHGETWFVNIVIARIYYLVNVSRTGKISKREFRRMDWWKMVECSNMLESPFNEMVYMDMYDKYNYGFEKYGIIDHRYLSEYNNGACGYYMSKRIMECGVSAFSDGRLGYSKWGMDLADFVYFVMALIVKMDVMSIQYFFNCLEMDGEIHEVMMCKCLKYNNLRCNDVPCNMFELCDSTYLNTPIGLNQLLSNQVNARIFYDALFDINGYTHFYKALRESKKNNNNLEMTAINTWFI